ncbi:MAG: DUF371 domain-containing protein [Candidatus Thorarchaeota archaeon]
MKSVSFVAYGHDNVVGIHKTTTELTTESFLTPQGTCIIGVKSDQTLSNLSDEIKQMVKSRDTRIHLKMKVNGESEEINGYGSPGLTYEDPTSMVARTSPFECGRTLMVNSDKAASDLKHSFIEELKKVDVLIECELVFVTE